MAKKTITKPSFEEGVAVIPINLPDVGLSFNAQSVGPMDFIGLRNADYGKGFRMPTMSELTQLVYASLENQDYETAKNVFKTLRNHLLTGNTGIHYTFDGMYVQENPDLRNREVFMDEKTLKNKLSSYEEKGVVFSDDRKIRFTPYGFKRGSQTPLELSKNSGIIALVNGEENAEKLARASSKYYKFPHFRNTKNPNLPQTSVASLYSSSLGDRLYFYADSPSSFSNMCSFGAKELE